MNVCLRILLIGFLLAAGPATGALAGTYVSLNGGFHITYPEDWYQVDYRTVDYTLSQGGSRRTIYNYEVALAPKASPMWNAGAYMMLTIDSIPNMTQKQIDSILQNLASSVDRPVNKNHPGMTFDAGWRPLEVAYWPDQNIGAVSIEPDVKSGDHTRTLVVLKFFPKGTANFYFYAPDTTWDASKGAFAGIMASFSTVDVEKALPKETLKVADANRLKEEPKSKGLPKSTVPVSGGIVVILIAILAARRRRARKQQENIPTE
ncbi:hypothetical protein C3F09_02240 [candidate division GN15 bacterium]|uniref:Uncharacterized protein n=1 Tax=candidate division GN15 bacterium TaxID=2072418 RepID=A0A855X4A4_9BACT|nr:MAG: hypothetical protein C3F09_02240 [candidate division GN15 bacterium]